MTDMLIDENAEITRYQRQILLPELGQNGQQKLKQAKVLCVGAGGLGSPVLLYLAAAGIGTLGIVDFDRVDISNLQRQILFNMENIGAGKVVSALQHLQALNSHTTYIPFTERLSPQNAHNILQGFDVIVDATDSFATKYLLNDHAIQLGKPLVYAAIAGWEGQVSVFWPPKTGCYRCLYPEISNMLIPTCAQAGVLGAICGLVGSVQAVEVIKLILCRDRQSELQPLFNQLWVIDSRNMQVKKIQYQANKECGVCHL